MTKNQRIEAKLARTSRAVFRLLRKTINLDSRLPFDFAQGLRRGNDTSVRVALVPNKELRRFKKKLLRKSVKIVDVLAFPDRPDFPHPESKVAPLGEVLVNEDIARRDFPRAVFLLVHGILHLLGYRHGKKRDSIVMEKLEREVLEKVIGDK